MALTKKKLFLSLIVFVVVLIVLFSGYTWLALHWSFSRGERVGYVQKISQKGWLVKTWEGELQMLPVPGAMPDKFVFSVRENSIAQKINGTVGKKVSVVYEQHKGVPTNFFGETEYYVTDVKVLE
jgi:sensor domain CHASE-containing protein